MVGVETLAEHLGAPNVYYLPRQASGDRPVPLARRPFGTDRSQETINKRAAAGARIVTLDLGGESPDSSSLPLIRVDMHGRPFIAPNHPHHGMAKTIVVTGERDTHSYTE